MKRIVLTLFASVAMLCASAQIKGKVQEIDMEQFAEKIGFILEQDTSFHFKGNRPAVVDFNATWCGPCRKLAPILDELAKQFKGKVDFYSVDGIKTNRLLKPCKCAACHSWCFSPKKERPKL
ncbi:MAG: thioredoxin domain-containing protein [Sodaliphilus sp.]|nr:thioredoxin domain-containing protein [Sodaliphilus sp.]